MLGRVFPDMETAPDGCTKCYKKRRINKMDKCQSTDFDQGCVEIPRDVFGQLPSISDKKTPASLFGATRSRANRKKTSRLNVWTVDDGATLEAEWFK